MREMASALLLHWLVGDGKCCVGVVGPMEKDQLAAQRETHLAAEVWQDMAA